MGGYPDGDPARGDACQQSGQQSAVYPGAVGAGGGHQGGVRGHCGEAGRRQGLVSKLQVVD